MPELMEGSPVVMMGMGIDQHLQIPTRVAAVLVAAEGIEVGMGIQCLQSPTSTAAMLERMAAGMVPPMLEKMAAVMVPLTDPRAAASIPWILLSSHHQYLVASIQLKHTIFVPLIHCHHILHCIMLVNAAWKLKSLLLTCWNILQSQLLVPFTSTIMI